MHAPSLHLTDSNTLWDSMQLWLESLQARAASPRTVQHYRQAVGAFVQFLNGLGIHHWEQVQPQHIRRWLLHRQQRGISTHTLHNDYRHPRTFCHWCIREGLTEHDPFARVEPPKKAQVIKRGLTPDEVEKLLQVTQGKHWLALRNRALILCLVATGLRVHECLGLRVRHASQSTVVVHGKGNKQRVVVLPVEVRLALARYLKAYPRRLEADDPLWWSATGHPMTLHGMKRTIRLLGKKAGLRVGAHALRRTFGTWCVINGMTLEHVRALYGHADLKTTMQYLYLTEQDLLDAYQKHNPLLRLQRVG